MARSVLAVDIGTTSVTAVLHPAGGQPQKLLLDGAFTAPARLLLDAAGTLVAGSAPAAPGRPRAVVPSVLDLLAQPSIDMGGARWPVARLLGQVLLGPLTAAREDLGHEVDLLVLTHPVGASPAQLQGLRTLADGLPVRTVLVSAATALAAHAIAAELVAHTDSGAVLVDLGAASSTVVTLARDGRDFTVAHTASVPFGGDTLDRALLTHLGQADPSLLQRVRSNPDDELRALTAARAARTSLSTAGMTTLRLPADRGERALDRDEAARVLAPALDAGLRVLLAAVHNRLAAPPDHLVLTGGLAGSPLVVEALTARTATAPVVAPDPQHAAAFGAAYWAEQGGDTAAPTSFTPPRVRTRRRRLVLATVGGLAAGVLVAALLVVPALGGADRPPERTAEQAREAVAAAMPGPDSLTGFTGDELEDEYEGDTLGPTISLSEEPATVSLACPGPAELGATGPEAAGRGAVAQQSFTADITVAGVQSEDTVILAVATISAAAAPHVVPALSTRAAHCPDLRDSAVLQVTPVPEDGPDEGGHPVQEGFVPEDPLFAAREGGVTVQAGTSIDVSSPDRMAFRGMRAPDGDTFLTCVVQRVDTLLVRACGGGLSSERADTFALLGLNRVLDGL